MENEIIVGILLVVIMVAIFRIKKYLKGVGCCGCGCNAIREKKIVTDPRIGEKV